MNLKEIKQATEKGFRPWLEIFMTVDNESWYRLSVWERDVLIDKCFERFWANFQYHNSLIDVNKFIEIVHGIREDKKDKKDESSRKDSPDP